MYVYVNHHWALYLSSGSVLATMNWPNLWSMVFFAMLALMAIVTMVKNGIFYFIFYLNNFFLISFLQITCLFSIFQSIFDEFEILRSRRTEVTFGIISILAVLSLYTCSNVSLIDFILKLVIEIYKHYLKENTALGF